MAKLYAKADGEITGLRLTAAEEANYPVPAEHAVSVLEFDEDTNPTILPAYAQDHNGHRLLAGVLTHNGVPYTITAAGESAQVRALAAQAVNDLTTYIGLANPSAAQRLAFERLVARVLRYLIRREFGL